MVSNRGHPNSKQESSNNSMMCNSRSQPSSQQNLPTGLLAKRSQQLQPKLPQPQPLMAQELRWMIC